MDFRELQLPDLQVHLDSPGEYRGSLQITAPGTTITVPVTILVTPIVPPVIGAIVNAASQIQGAVAPGGIVSIYGFAVGPPSTLGFTLDPSGTVATICVADLTANCVAGLNRVKKIAEEGVPAPGPAALKPVDVHTRAAEDRLRLVLGTRVRIVRQGPRGRIEIDFGSEDELIRLYEQLTARN